MKKKISLFLGFTFFIVITMQSSAQTPLTDNLYVNSNYHYGFVLPEYSSFTYTVNKPVQSLSLSVSKQTIGKNSWQELYNYPELGISLFYTTLGNKQINGVEYAIFPFATLHLLYKKRFSIDNTLGVGLGYATKKFDINNNYTNIVVGSHLNIHFNCKLGMQYFITPKLVTRMGLSFDHLSNGNLQEPNIGINNFTAYGGVVYLIGKPLERIINEKQEHKKDWEYEVVYSIGGKHARVFASKFYLTSSLSAAAKWKIFKGFHLGIGADLFYDSSSEVEILAKKNEYKKAYDYSSGIHISQQVVYNRLSIILQEGAYVFMPNKAINKFMYNRGIVKYQATKHFSVRMTMKSHLHILDYPELGFGYNW